jgi:hypothetical protein
MGLCGTGNVFTTIYEDAVDYTIEGQRCTEDMAIHGHTSDELAKKTRDSITVCSKMGISKMDAQKNESIYIQALSHSCHPSAG